MKGRSQQSHSPMAVTKGSRVNADRLPENRKERSADGRSALFCMLAFGKREMVKEWKMEERTQPSKACFRSAMMSLAFSRPMDRRTVLG